MNLLTLTNVLLGLIGRGDGLSDLVGKVVKKIEEFTDGEKDDPIPPPMNVRKAQELLKAGGFDPGPIDGRWGPKTSKAVLEYQKTDPALVDDGLLGQKTWEALLRDNES